MKNANAVMLVILILLVGSALQLMHYYPLMPDRMATHFGINMEADAWTPKRSFFTTYALVEVGMLIVLLIPVFLQRRIPTSMISMPHADYWFAPERFDETWLKLTTFSLWMAAATLGFLIAVAESMFRANLADTMTPTLSTPFFWALGIYLGLVAIGTIRFYVHFSRVPRDPNTPPRPE